MKVLGTSVEMRNPIANTSANHIPLTFHKLLSDIITNLNKLTIRDVAKTIQLRGVNANTTAYQTSLTFFKLTYSETNTLM